MKYLDVCRSTSTDTVQILELTLGWIESMTDDVVAYVQSSLHRNSVNENVGSAIMFGGYYYGNRLTNQIYRIENYELGKT